MIDILTDFSQPALATAVKANLYAFFESMKGSTTVAFDSNAEAIRWKTGFAHSWFNGVLSRRPPDEDTTRTVGEAVAYFRSSDVHSFTWWLAPDLEPTSWAGYLEPHGFLFDDNTPGMAMDLADLPAKRNGALTIRRVEDRPALAEYVRTMLQGFGIPETEAATLTAVFEDLGLDLPIRHYLGLLNDRPVATVALVLGAGVAGIYNVATLPEARGRGIGSAMTLAPLYEARDMGYQAGILQSSKMGYGVYRRLGFREVGRVKHYYWRKQLPGKSSS
jgi:ribosomal protein S18 acetylase RimI-like enzyme